jgi:hypothetical protein
MREFFKGWRRKAGCVTLVMALALGGLWVRSFSDYDFFLFPVLGRQNLCSTSAGRVTWWSIPITDPTEVEWRHGSAMAGTHGAIGFYLMTSTDGMDSDQRAQLRLWTAPHSFLVVPLTLLSAYLILWKPRPKER